LPGLLYLIFAPLGSIPHPHSDSFNQKLSSLVVFLSVIAAVFCCVIIDMAGY
jgi:hypothetical protein